MRLQRKEFTKRFLRRNCTSEKSVWTKKHYILDVKCQCEIDNVTIQAVIVKSWLWWAWWRHEMETFSALLAFCAGNAPVHGEFPAQRPVTRSFDVLSDLRPNKRLSKQLWGWWSETLYDVIVMGKVWILVTYKCVPVRISICLGSNAVDSNFFTACASMQAQYLGGNSKSSNLAIKM